MESVVAEKYAIALLQVAREKKAVEVIEGEMQKIQKALEALPGLKERLEHPRLKADEKIQALKELLGADLSKTLENFVRILIAKKRIQYFKAVADRFENLCYEMRGEAIGRVLTPQPLTSGQKKELSERLEKTFGLKVELREEVKPELIGGIVIYLGHQRMDTSVLEKLQQMKQRLMDVEIRQEP